jgi:hypothetical protein
MRQASIFVAIGLLAGIVLASWIGREPLPTLVADAIGNDPGSTGAASSERELAARVAGLETMLAAETRRHASLESELAALREQIDELSEAGAEDLRISGSSNGTDGNESEADPRVLAGGRRFAAALRSPEYRLNRLIEAGFTADEAQALIDRESQMRLEMMNASYEARREGGQLDPQVDMQRRRDLDMQLRADLGDDRYERYLAATGQPTSVNIGDVLSNSAGAIAGLQPGDEIVGYAGERIFNLLDLRTQTIDGEPGETVPVDIVRDGQPMQLYIERGPLGITGSGFTRRGPGNAIVIP